MTDRLFDPGARERIREAVRAAERLSVGQIVPVVVESSVPHETGVERLAWLGLLAASVAMLALGRPDSVALFALIQVGAAALFAGAAFVPEIQRRLLGRRHLEAATRERALRAFYEHGLDRTERRTGVLIFASLLERRVVIMGDEGIHARMGDEGWSEAVRLFVDRLRTGAPVDGFCEAIAHVGQVLAEHFPRDAARPKEGADRRAEAAGPEHSKNELPDDLEVDP